MDLDTTLTGPEGGQLTSVDDRRPDAEAPVVATTERRRSPRLGIWLAGFVAAAVSAAALFSAGYALGTQRSLTPGTPADQQALFAPYWEAYNKIASSYVGTFTPKALVEGSIKGMFEALKDPFSSYMTSEEYKASLSGISGQFEGIGAQMQGADPTGHPCDPLGPQCALTVTHVIRKSPAQKAGLLDGDVVAAIDGVTVDGQKLSEAVDKIRGARGTDVRLSLKRGGSPLEITITRDVVESEEVTTTSLAGGTVNQIKVAGFSSAASADLRAALKEGLDAGVRRYILDLRDDPGGFVNGALDIANQFIASGPIYWEEDAAGNDTAHNATGDGLATDPGIALVVLVNGGTASASEIVTGALQDTGRATVIGTKTYGKGTIQQWILLSSDSGGFRLSTAKWLTPDKTWIHGKGITPDIVVEQPTELAIGQDPQLDRALAEVTAKPVSAAPSAAPASPYVVPASP